jgi:putative spermidine/putrescine transport system substrate-binding protein
MRVSAWLATSAIALIVPGAALADTVALAGYSGLFKERYVKAVVEPFMAKNPDIKVEFFAMPNSAQMLGTLRAHKSAPQIDVAILDVTVSKVGTDEQLFARVDESVSANVAHLIPAARREPAPTSWEALWDKQFDDKLALPAVPDIQGIALTVIADKLAGGADYTKSLEAGYGKLEELAPMVQSWEPKPDIYTAVSNGQIALGISWNARAQSFSETLPNLKVAIPQEGTSFQMNTINLVANGPAGESARKFIDYALSVEAQSAFANAMFYSPTNSKATVEKDAADRLVSTETGQAVDINWLEIAKLREGITEEWRRRIIPLSR